MAAGDSFCSWWGSLFFLLFLAECGEFGNGFYGIIWREKSVGFRAQEWEKSGEGNGKKNGWKRNFGAYNERKDIDFKDQNQGYKIYCWGRIFLDRKEKEHLLKMEYKLEMLRPKMMRKNGVFA
ncbi:Uncharacterized protein Fot_06841 [Forsythia ovata]|uniref:Uncharacterized protein n=1 Tax=Forsythia ovata TaxID=205694 RepID=A0ABD1WY78_9LAMI